MAWGNNMDKNNESHEPYNENLLIKDIKVGYE
jgi:hypothetical protein